MKVLTLLFFIFSLNSFASFKKCKVTSNPVIKEESRMVRYDTTINTRKKGDQRRNSISTGEYIQVESQVSEVEKNIENGELKIVIEMSWIGGKTIMIPSQKEEAGREMEDYFEIKTGSTNCFSDDLLKEKTGIDYVSVDLEKNEITLEGSGTNKKTVKFSCN